MQAELYLLNFGELKQNTGMQESQKILLWCWGQFLKKRKRKWLFSRAELGPLFSSGIIVKISNLLVSNVIDISTLWGFKGMLINSYIHKSLFKTQILPKLYPPEGYMGEEVVVEECSEKIHYIAEKYKVIHKWDYRVEKGIKQFYMSIKMQNHLHFNQFSNQFLTQNHNIIEN